MKRGIQWGAWGAAAVVGATVLLTGLPGAADEKQSDDAALARTRKQVQVLDDLYKTVIVMITENYVNESSDLAAGAAFQKVFDGMRQKGHHDVQLLDCTGEPYDDKNVADDEFEKTAIAAIKAGKPAPEQTIEKDGKRYLRTATAIPVVMQKCTLCHPAYENAKPGEAIGALSYTIAVE
jgi:hypothetical protein